MIGHAKAWLRAVCLPGVAIAGVLPAVLFAFDSALGQDSLMTTRPGEVYNSSFSVNLPKRPQWTEVMSGALRAVFVSEPMAGCPLRAAVVWISLDPTHLTVGRPLDESATTGDAQSRRIASVKLQEAVLNDGIGARIQDHASRLGGSVVFQVEPLQGYNESGALCKSYEIVVTNDAVGAESYVRSLGQVCVHPDLIAAVLLEYTEIHPEVHDHYPEFRSEGQNFVDSLTFTRR